MTGAGSQKGRESPRRASNATIAPGYVGLFWLAAGMTAWALGASLWDLLRHP